MDSDQSSESEAYYLDQLLDRTPRASRVQDRTPRPAKLQGRPSVPLRLSPAHSSNSSRISDYTSYSNGDRVASGNETDNSHTGESAISSSHRATRSRTRELAPSVSQQDTHVSLRMLEESPERTVTIDFAITFDQVLPTHLLSRNLPESVCRIADNVCRAWDARWVLSRAKISAKDSRFRHWKLQSLRLIDIACTQTDVWPAMQLNRVFGLSRLLMDVDPDWELPTAVQDALPGQSWITGGSQYAPSNMMAQLQLWSPVNRACTECQSKSRVTICAVSSVDPGGKCYFCALRSKTCSLNTNVTNNELLVHDTGGCMTWGMVLKHNKSRLAASRSASAIDVESMDSDVHDELQSSGDSSARVVRKNASGATGKKRKGASSRPHKFSVKTELDHDSETLIVYSNDRERKILGHIADPSRPEDEESLVYRAITPDGTDTGNGDIEDNMQDIHDAVAFLAKEIKLLIETDQQAQQDAMRELQDYQSHLSALMARGARKLAGSSADATQHQDNHLAGSSRDPQPSDSGLPAGASHSPDAKGKGTIPALRIGPWDAFRAKDANIFTLVETLITELPRGYDFYLPTTVRPGNNAKFVVACFKDADNRDGIMEEWRKAGGRYGSITVTDVMVTRAFALG